MHRKVVIIQARLGSSRLPGKVLEPICGMPMIWHVIQRAMCVGLQTIVATSEEKSNEPLVDWLDEYSVDYVVGSEHDVHRRVHDVIAAVQAPTPSHIIRVTGDAPLLSLEYMRMAAMATRAEDLLRSEYDEVTPMLEGAELVSMDVLRWLWQHWRNDGVTMEHVTPRAYMHPLAHGVARFVPRPKEEYIKLSVDTRDDLDRVRRVYEALWDGPGSLIPQAQAVKYLKGARV